MLRFILIFYNLICIVTSATTTTVCSTTALTTTVTSTALPTQCTNATMIIDPTRSAGYTGALGCDLPGPFDTPGWFQFSGAGGTILANCAVPENSCGAQSTGWYSGVYPSTAGDTINGTVCYNFLGNTCVYSNSISITNCNGYYVFYLSPPPQCNLRYCTI